MQTFLGAYVKYLTKKALAEVSMLLLTVSLPLESDEGETWRKPILINPPLLVQAV
jgi:hypothetical protein